MQDEKDQGKVVRGLTRYILYIYICIYIYIYRNEISRDMICNNIILSTYIISWMQTHRVLS